jgi:DNA-binding IclR family transcriptional regulator
MEELKRVRETGYAMDNEEREIGLNCIEVPIHNARSQIIAFLGTSIPAQRFSPTIKKELLASTVKAGNEISVKLGYIPKMQRRDLISIDKKSIA